MEHQQQLIGDLQESNLANEQKLKHRQLESLIELREKYAQRAFAFMARYATVTVIIVVANGLKIIEISSAPLVALIGTISASMILFGWVLRGLFNAK